jgi:hypothetical protein
MPKRCPRGFVCTDWSTVYFAAILIIGAAAVAIWFSTPVVKPRVEQKQEPNVIVIQQPQNPMQILRPDLYPEPVQRFGSFLPSLASRGPTSPYQQIGILTAEGGSSSSAAPDRTILPLYGRELDSRRGRWNYYTRTDGANPVQVPVRIRNRVCDDDTNGCEEIYDSDAVHVPSLGRSFKSTIYRKSFFG